jgi:hypothetical protein
MLWASQASHEACITNGMEKDKGAKRAVAEDVVTIPGVDMGPYFIAILCHTNKHPALTISGNLEGKR